MAKELKVELSVKCCFCGEALPAERAVEIAFRQDKTSDEWQLVYSHAKCLDDKLGKDIPRTLEI